MKNTDINNEVNNFAFKEAYILPTTSEQDKTIRETFIQKADEGYNIVSNQCAQVVRQSLNAAGIKTELPYIQRITDRKHGDIYYINTNTFYNPFMPAELFRAVIRNNPNGLLIRR